MGCPTNQNFPYAFDLIFTPNKTGLPSELRCGINSSNAYLCDWDKSLT